MDDLGSIVAESVFALALEKIADRAAEALLDDVVGVDERNLQPLGQVPPDSGLAGRRAGRRDCDRPAVARDSGYARQRAALRSVIIFGVMKTSISVLLATRLRVRNRLPDPANHPAPECVTSSLVSVSSKIPPMTTVPPFSTSTWVWTCLVLIAMPAVVVSPTAVLVDVQRPG